MLFLLIIVYIYIYIYISAIFAKMIAKITQWVSTQSTIDSKQHNLKLTTNVSVYYYTSSGHCENKNTKLGKLNKQTSNE